MSNLILSLKDRANFYHVAFPKYPELQATDRWLYGIWIIGNSYKGSSYYGSYLGNYLKRVLSLFPDMDSVLHLFSGSIHDGLTLDINPAVNPKIVASAEDIPLQNNSLELILADTPYSSIHAAKYGYEMINRKKVFAECYRILIPGGFMVWLDTVLPMYAKKNWSLVGTIGIIAGTNRLSRMTTIYQKVNNE